MSRIAYKTDYFKCTLSTAKKFDAQLWEMLERNAGEGWLLHSWHVIEGSICEAVFYREEP